MRWPKKPDDLDQSDADWEYEKATERGVLMTAEEAERHWRYWRGRSRRNNLSPTERMRSVARREGFSCALRRQHFTHVPDRVQLAEYPLWCIPGQTMQTLVDDWTGKDSDTKHSWTTWKTIATTVRKCSAVKIADAYFTWMESAESRMEFIGQFASLKEALTATGFYEAPRIS